MAIESEAMSQIELTQNNTLLRKRIRKQRLQLSDQELTRAERQLKSQVNNYSPLLAARKIASYLPCNGEISPKALESALPRATVYYPRITNISRCEMHFYRMLTPVRRNPLGILEPSAIGEPMPVQHFDAILLPLVAFDRAGNRLGMGAGFYDRALSFKLHNTSIRRPHLIGLAHHFQEVKSLTAQSWDVPLDAILTDIELIAI